VRRVSGHFRSGIETMIREAELEEMEKKWREQNAAIMAATSTDPTHYADPAPAVPAAQLPAPDPVPVEAQLEAPGPEEPKAAARAEPQLPFPPP